MKNKILIFIVMSLMILVGCNDSDKHLIDGQIIKSKESKEIIKQIAAPILNCKTLNPIISQDESAYQINPLIYDSLVDINQSFVAKPSLAESWNYEDEGKVLRLNLKSNVKWHDGRNFTADDVVFTINTILNPGVNRSSQYQTFIKNINNVEKIDNYTVKITFKTAYDNAIENFIFPIIASSYYSSYSDVYNAIENYKPIGTGPYVVSAIEKSKYIQLIKNENYWGEKVPNNDIKLEIVPSLEDSIGLLEIDSINMTVSKRSDWNKYLQDKTLSIKEFVSNEVEVVGFNFYNPVLSNKDVRQAIAYAIDAGEIIDNIYLGSAIESDTPYIPNYLGINKYSGQYEMDLEKSESLLTGAGFINRDKDEYLEDANGYELRFNILANYENKNRMDSAELIKKHLKEVGIVVDITYMNYDQYLNKIKGDQYDMYLGGLSFSHLMDLRFALYSKADNFTNYKNDYLDILLVEMQRNISSKQKEEYFIEIKEILMEDLPYYTLFYKEHAIIAEKSIQGNIEPNFMNIFEGIESWYIEK